MPRDGGYGEDGGFGDGGGGGGGGDGGDGDASRSEVEAHIDAALADCTVCIGEMLVSLAALEFNPLITAPPRRYGVKRTVPGGDGGEKAAQETVASVTAAAVVEKDKAKEKEEAEAVAAAAAAVTSERKPRTKRWKQTKSGWFEKVDPRQR